MAARRDDGIEEIEIAAGSSDESVALAQGGEVIGAAVAGYVREEWGGRLGQFYVFLAGERREGRRGATQRMPRAQTT
jgi:hypothetical protein